jgi:hypothetical protein
MVDLMTLLASGHIIEAIFGAYTGAMGNWFFLAIFGLGLTMLYIKTKNFEGTVILGAFIIVPKILSILVPEVHPMIYFMAALAVTIILYKIFY